MTPLAQFWIARHDDFRAQCAVLQAANDAWRENNGDLEAYTRTAASRTRFLIAHLQGHHQIEDYHYFPAFRAVDARLAAGFDVLAGDHDILNLSGRSAIETLDALQESLAAGRAAETLQRAANRYVDAADALYRRILRHLDDEEDLVIPLMLALGYPGSDRGFIFGV